MQSSGEDGNKRMKCRLIVIQILLGLASLGCGAALTADKSSDADGKMSDAGADAETPFPQW